MLKMTNFMIWEFTGTRFAGKTELSLSSGRYITHYGVKPTWTSRLLDENKWKIHFHRSKWSMAAARSTFDPPREDRNGSKEWSTPEILCDAAGDSFYSALSLIEHGSSAHKSYFTYYGDSDLLLCETGFQPVGVLGFWPLKVTCSYHHAEVDNIKQTSCFLVADFVLLAWLVWERLVSTSTYQRV